MLIMLLWCVLYRCMCQFVRSRTQRLVRRCCAALRCFDDAMTSWRLVVRHLSLTRIFFAALGFCALSLVILAYFVSLKTSSPSPSHSPPKPRLSPDLSCLSDVRRVRQTNNHGQQSSLHVHTEPRVLLLVETPYTRLGRSIVYILESVRFKHRVQVTSPGSERKILPSLTHGDRGRFAVIVFERLEMYLSLDSWNRQLLDKYCRDFHVGVVAFAQPDEVLFNAQVCHVIPWRNILCIHDFIFSLIFYFQ